MHVAGAQQRKFSKHMNRNECGWISVGAQFKSVIFQDVVAELEQGILVERLCAQLVEQHEAAQDWLREQVKGLPAPPEEMEALHGAVNTLKVSKRLNHWGTGSRHQTFTSASRLLVLTISSPSSRLCSSLWIGSRGK